MSATGICADSGAGGNMTRPMRISRSNEDGLSFGLVNQGPVLVQLRPAAACASDAERTIRARIARIEMSYRRFRTPDYISRSIITAKSDRQSEIRCSTSEVDVERFAVISYVRDYREFSRNSERRRDVPDPFNPGKPDFPIRHVKQQSTPFPPPPFAKDLHHNDTPPPPPPPPPPGPHAEDDQSVNANGDTGTPPPPPPPPPLGPRMEDDQSVNVTGGTGTLLPPPPPLPPGPHAEDDQSVDANGDTWLNTRFNGVRHTP
ncbi:hypothetical protein B0H10DRAFT_1959476 [Mycena sp. CBHHK59/15]|nr:hypothetical protein B0H10DRAFT_1959476 [Mycena sp. CBHHK59/15]